MATTAVTSASTATTSATTAQTTQAAKRASAQSIITALSAGSGVDVAALAQGLVDAEKLPQAQQINTKISKSEARVSGYAAISFMLKTMNESLVAMKDANSFNASSVSNSNTAAFGVTTSVGAASGSHSVSIASLASAQRNTSTSFAASSTALNAGSSFTMDLKIGTDAIAAASTSTAAVSGLTINGTAIDAVSADPTVVTTQGYSAIDTAPAQAETSVITFAALAAGQKVTVNGMTFTATAAMASADVAAAFASLTSDMSAATATSTNTTSAALGTYSGTFTAGFTTGTVSGSTVTATSTTSANVTDIAITARKFDNLAIAINAKTSTTGVTAVNTAGSVALTGASINLGTTANSTKAITGISSTVTVTVAAGDDTPQGLVDAINAADLAVSARLVNTGSTSSPTYKVLLSGAEGSAGVFSMSTTPSSVLTALNFTETAAADAVLTVDGVTYTRSSNSVTDAIEGVTLTLSSTTTTAASINLTRDTTQIKTKITALVTAYNDVNNILTEVSNSKSTLDTYGATLVGDSVVRQVRSQLRDMLLGESSSPGTNVSALWQMGLSIDRTGVMTLNSTKLDAALSSNFKDVVKTFTGNQNNRSATSPPFSTSSGYASATTSINADAAFSVSLVNSTGTFVVPIAVGSTTPQGVVDAINASKQGFSAQLVQDSTGTTPYKIMVMGSTGSSGFTVSANDGNTAVSGLTFAANGSGIAGDAFRKISALLAPDGVLLTQTANATTQADKLKASLEVLQTRMQALLDRYTKQFAAMESLVGNINSQKTSLKTSFDGMMSIYTNK